MASTQTPTVSTMRVVLRSERAFTPAQRSSSYKNRSSSGGLNHSEDILNAELYIGQRVWNRLEFHKDPDTHERVSVPRPESEWIRHEDMDFAIVPRELWNAVKARQAGQASRRLKHWTGDRNQLSGCQALRQRKYLLSGLLECGICGGKMTVAGTGARKRYYCANHREMSAAVCPGMPGLLYQANRTLGVLSKMMNLAETWGIRDKHTNPCQDIERYPEHKRERFLSGKEMKRLRKEAGLDNVRIHDLRHTFASGALLVGEGLPMIGKLLGHTQVQTTARYAHLASDPMKAAATRIAGRLAEALG